MRKAVAVDTRSAEASAPAAQAQARILYCRCAYANVVPAEVKHEVLRRLCASGAAFDAVADLCEMSARRDPALGRLAAGEGEIRIAACYPRAVHWLFAAAGAALPQDRVEVLNLRKLDADEAVEKLLAPPCGEGEEDGG
jgi:hypothetical protein